MDTVTNNDATQSDKEEVKIEDPSDKLTPDHPRFKEVWNQAREVKEENATLKRELEELKAKVDQRQEDTGSSDLTQTEIEALEKIEKHFKQKGYLTRDDYLQDKSVERDASEYNRLSNKYNGENGLPKFVRDDVILYAKQNGFGSNYEAAYKEMHFDAIINQRVKEQENRLKSPTIEKPSVSSREIKGAQVTTEDIANMSPQEYEKHREKILEALKKG